jgi:hypothetical protein
MLKQVQHDGVGWEAARNRSGDASPASVILNLFQDP